MCCKRSWKKQAVKLSVEACVIPEIVHVWDKLRLFSKNKQTAYELMALELFTTTMKNNFNDVTG